MNIFSERKTSTKAKNLFRQTEFDNILKCVHCGLCLDSCPTYRELGDEKDSPRGRLFLMRGLWEGDLELEDSVIKPLSRCLDCRACESACPSGVPYGELLEKTRGIILENTNRTLKERILRIIFLKNIFCSTNLLILLSKLIKIYIISGIPKIITKTFFRNFFPKSFVFKQYLIPNFSGESFKIKYSKKILGPLDQEIKFQNNIPRVGMFSGCIMDVSEEVIHNSTLTLLRYLGCEVHIPKDQSCCGALHVHSGDRKTSRKLALENLEAFKSFDLDAIITNAAGCGAQLKEYNILFSDTTYKKRKIFSGFEKKVIDIMEFIYLHQDRLKSLDWRKDEETILYDAPCHLIHAQQVNKNPQKILKDLPGVTLEAIEDSEWCCGSAGIYNLCQPELSTAILHRKTQSIFNSLKNYSNATTLVTGNVGCLYQIRAGIKIKNIDIRVLHPIVFLADRLIKNESQKIP